MNVVNVIEYAVAGLLALVLVSLVAGHVLGYPVLLSYVESDSMEPTLDEGDGFVAVPEPLAGDVGMGDVVVFDAERIEGGELTTHRIVDEREGGYVTQGDGNLVADQSGGEPLVTDGQVKAVALSVDGTVVTIPHLGSAVGAVGVAFDRVERTVAGWLGAPRLGSQQLAYLLFGLGLLAFTASLVFDGIAGRDRERTRSRSQAGMLDARLVLGGCLLLLIGGAIVGMVAPAGTETYGVVSSEGNSSNPTIVPAGESDSFQYDRHNGGVLPVVSYLEPSSDGVDVNLERTTLSRNETVNATVTFHAPPETGYYHRSVTEHRYFALVPPSVIDAAYRVHPWLPYALISAVITFPVLVLWWLWGPRGTVRVRRRQRSDRAPGGLV